MTPAIPLTPQQKRRRRNNIIFIGVGACAAIAALGFLFYPEEGLSSLFEAPAATDKSEGGSITTNAVPSTANSDQTAGDAPSTTAPTADSATGATSPAPRSENAQATGATPAANSTTAPVAPPSADTINTAANAATAAAADATAQSTDSDSPAEEPENEHGLTEEELAKLPAWQADFIRLSEADRIAFAQAFTKAKAAYNSEQWASCLALLNDCELIYNGSPNVWNLRACALLASDQLAEAEPCIARSLSLNPNDSVALMCQSELHMLRQEYRASIAILEKLRNMHKGEADRALHDAFTYHQLLCHLMLRQEMEARALVAGLSPLCDTPLYYYAEAAFCLYKGDSRGSLEPLRSAGNIFGNAGATSSYRKWLNKCGLADKYLRSNRR